MSQAVRLTTEVAVALPDLARARSAEDLGESGIGLTQHERAAGLHDPGLLGRDVHQGGADGLGMVETHVGDDSNLAVGDVGGVPPSAEADLDDADVYGDVGVPPERGGREDL